MIRFIFFFFSSKNTLNVPTTIWTINFILIRSNTSREVGFLSESRRLNVAVTRARRHLTVVCDSTTVGSNAFIQTLLDHAHRVGEVISAQEWIDDGIVSSATVGGGGGERSHIDNTKPPSSGYTKKVAAPTRKNTGVSAGKKKELNATDIATSLVEAKSTDARREEADPWAYLKTSIDTFVGDRSEREFHFSETLSAKGPASAITGGGGLFLLFQKEQVQ